MSFHLSTFSVEITPPIGAPLCGGGVEAAQTIEDPQFARGFVLRGSHEPIVLVVLDCLGTYNDTHDRLRELIAQAAGTLPRRVFLSSVHQHDAPIYDVSAQKLLDTRGQGQAFCDVEHLKAAARSLQSAITEAMQTSVAVTHVGVGEASVNEVASNRRILDHDKRVSAFRGSSCKNPEVRAEPEGLIDPMLKCVTFFNESRPVLALNHYATHPMSYYGKGGVSADFCGLARARRQEDDPDCFQIYLTGCAGNIAAGKYNDGSPENRAVLAGRMYDAMVSAADAVKPEALRSVGNFVVPMALPIREEPGFMEADCLDVIEGTSETSDDWRRSAMCLSWRRRGREPIDVQKLDLGVAQLILLPGEPFVEYQIAAHQMKPNDFILTIGYGNGGPGYLCTDVAYRQGGYESGGSAFSGPGAEAPLHQAIRDALEGAAE